jgi:putative FmdB family regulatory protein
MPIYEYTCRNCGTTFDRRLPMAERLSAKACPSCGRAEATLRMSLPAMVGSTAGAGNRPVCPSSGAACTCGRGHH